MARPRSRRAATRGERSFPCAEAGKSAAAGLVTFADESNLLEITVDPQFLPFLKEGTEYEFGPVLLSAYVLVYII